MSIKIDRIASNMSKEVSIIIENEVKDPDVKFVTITGCTVTNDLSYAKIYFTCALDIDKKSIEKELEEASSYVRHELSSRIEIRHTPKLVFKFDESIEYGNHIESIINEIHEEDNERNN